MKKKLLIIFLSIPLITLGQVQIGQDINGENVFDRSGTSVSLSSDGSIVAIGAPENDGNGSNSGHVRIYKNQGGMWVQLGQDINGGEIFDRFGTSVNLSSDGSVVAIGSPFNDGNGINDNCYVSVYKYQGGTWVQIGQNINGIIDNDRTGWSLSLSSDGSIVAIGAPFNDGNSINDGQVRIYENQGGTWTQIGQDINGEAGGNLLGISLSLSSNGSIVAIGINHNSSVGTEIGQVQIYKNQGGTWTQIGQDINGETDFDRSGTSVSLSSDGSIVAIGAPQNDGNGNNSGHVRVYKNQLGNWVQIGADIDGEAAGDKSGSSVSLSSSGDVLVIGANENDGNGNNSGQVRIYKNQGGTWSQIGQDINGEALDDESGTSVSLSSDGSVVAIGAPENDGNDNNSGHVRVYDLSTLLSLDDYLLSRFSLEPNPTKTHFNIHLKDNIELIKVSIYNNLGQLVKVDYKENINVSSFSKGIYFVEIITNKGKASKKIIIE